MQSYTDFITQPHPLFDLLSVAALTLQLAELSSRDPVARKPKIVTIWSFKKKCADPYTSAMGRQR